MATIEDYVSGKVCDQIAKCFAIFDAADGSSLAGTPIGAILSENVAKLAPRKLSCDQAIQLIAQARQCAVGPRVCTAVHTEAPLTEAVFLDELAEAMVRAGKAVAATQAEAIANVKKYRKQPIIVTKVSGKHAEICPTWAKKCIYWNMEKHRLKCIQR
jgi:hypothetical protein